jgi:hypothetical protein
MKYIILISIMFAFASCEKGKQIVAESCNCGEVIKKNKIQHVVYNTWYYQLTLDNNCTGNDFVYDATQSEYNNYLLGDSYCFPSKTW